MNWLNGEKFETIMLIMIGLLLITLALFFWRFGNSPTSNSLFLPILIVGMFWGIVGSISYYNHQHKVEKYKTEFANSPSDFLIKEKKRIEGFESFYKYELIGWISLTIIGVALFYFSSSDRLHAISIAILLFTITGFLIYNDHFKNSERYLQSYLQVQVVTTVKMQWLLLTVSKIKAMSPLSVELWIRTNVYKTEGI